MRDLRLIPDLFSSPRKSSASLFQAVLANMENGVARGHIGDDPARDFFNKLRERVLALGIGASFSAIEVEIVYNQATYVFADMVVGSYLQRRGPLTCDEQLRAFTIKPLYKVQSWLNPDLVPDAKADQSARVARQCCDMFADPANRTDVNLCASNQLLWFSPYTRGIAREFEELDAKREDEVEILPNATHLRNKLGLFQQEHGQHLIGVVTRKTIRELCGSSRCAAAPTVFDAWTYERYRHWPVMHDVDCRENIGRSYELDTGRRRPGHANQGLQEFVTLPMGVDEVEKLIYLGVVRDTTRYDDPENHEKYADDIACGAMSDALLGTLADRLGL